MSRKNARMKACEYRKQLLIAESELNRTHLIHELQTMTGDVHALARQAKTAGSIASVAALVVGGLSFFRHKTTTPASEKPSRWQAIGKVAGIVATFWAACRSRPKS